ncbi:MAG: ABC transporter permease [Bacteroidales bacterium]|nr:ABC transporter permease [Bacteroidales bacterium]
MIWSVSWRNVWRSKVRSAVIIIAIALGIFAGVFTWAFYYGMVDQRLETAIKTEVSHIQLHNPKYMVNPDMINFIPNIQEVKTKIEQLPSVSAVSCRTVQNALITSAETGSGLRIVGINPEEEQKITDIYTKVIDGTYLTGIKRNPILIGEKLAEKLNVKVRSKVVVIMQQMDGTMTKGSFRIAGIYKTTNSMYDEMNAFIRVEDLRNLTHFEASAGHEIAILLKNNQDVESTLADLKTEFPDLDVKSWREISPEVSLVEETMDISMYFILIIILFALGFGIINTMLMAILERVKELGMLMAVGMNRRRVFSMIVLETVFLTLTGGVLGILLGYAAALIFMRTGIDLSAFSEAYERMGYDPVIYPVLKLNIAVKVTILVIITGLLAAIYPAVKALHLKPAEALRIDM